MITILAEKSLQRIVCGQQLDIHWHTCNVGCSVLEAEQGSVTACSYLRIVNTNIQQPNGILLILQTGASPCLGIALNACIFMPMLTAYSYLSLQIGLTRSFDRKGTSGSCVQSGLSGLCYAGVARFRPLSLTSLNPPDADARSAEWERFNDKVWGMQMTCCLLPDLRSALLVEHDYHHR